MGAGTLEYRPLLDYWTLLLSPPSSPGSKLCKTRQDSKTTASAPMMNPPVPARDMREYGNTVQALRRVAIVGLVIGLLGAVASLILLYCEGKLRPDAAWLALFLVLMPAAVICLGVLPTVLFHIRLGGGHVQHVFLGRYILSDLPIRDFLHVGLRQRGCAAVLHFKGGRKIHFFGAHQGVIARLAKDLAQARHEAD